MSNDKQFLIPQKLNRDVDYRIMGQDECTYKLNLRTGLTAGGNAPSSENFLGNTEITNPYRDDADIVIGSAPDISNDSIIYMVYNPDATKHKIIRYFPYNNDLVELILQHEYLNFQLTHKITSINVIDGLLYWTEGYFTTYLGNDFNPPRKINLAKAKKFTYTYNGTTERSILSMRQKPAGTNTWFRIDGTNPFAVGNKVVTWVDDGDTLGTRYKPLTGYGTVTAIGVDGGVPYVETDIQWVDTVPILNKTGHIMFYDTDMYFGIDWQVIDRIKYPPNYSPDAVYQNDVRDSNNLRNRLFQFALRYVYDDNEKSTISPISYPPLPTTMEVATGGFNYGNYDNAIDIAVDLGPNEVVSVDVLVREGNTGDWKIAKTIQKFNESDAVLLTGTYTYRFFNDEVPIPVDQADIKRSFDFVVQTAEHEEIIEKTRLVDANYREGYDNLDINVSLELDSHVEDVIVANPNIPVNAIEYSANLTLPPLTPPGNEINKYLRSRTWSDGSVGPTHTFNYTCLMLNLSQIPLIGGGIYVFTIDLTNLDPGVSDNYYKDKSFLPAPAWPAEFLNDKIVATVVVAVADTDTIEDITNKIAAGLRSTANTSDYSAIGVTHAPYKAWTNNIWGTFTSTVGAMYPYELGIVLPIGIGQAGLAAPFNVSMFLIGSTNKFTHWKGGTTAKLSLEYVDRGERTGASQVSDLSEIVVPYQNDGGELRRNTMTWNINHRPPTFATHYRWMRAKDNSLSYYVQVPVSEIGYPTSFGATLGEFLTIAVQSNFLKTKQRYGKFNVAPYEFQVGDRLRFAFKSETTNYTHEVFTTFANNLDFEIVSVYVPVDTGIGNTYTTDETYIDSKYAFITDSNGNKVKRAEMTSLVIHNFNFRLNGIDIDNLASKKIIVEIYRPTKKSDEVVYYAMSGYLPIGKPHTSERYHIGPTQSQVFIGALDDAASLPAVGTFGYGDSYLIPRFTSNNTFDSIFPCESKWYSDWYDSEVHDIGKINAVNRDMSSKVFYNNLRYSGKLVEDTRINDLSRCEGGDYDVLPKKFDSINGIKEVGDVLRVIQTEKCTSIYIGKVGFKQTPGSPDVVSVSEGVIGTKYFHPETYGTVFPESVVTSVNFTYFFDIYNSAMCRWANNGVNQIVGKESSTGWDFGMKTYFTAKSKALLASGIENVNVYCTYEKEFENLIVTFVDHINSDNSETIMFHEPTNSWITFASFIPDNYGTIGLVLTSSLNGYLYKHNTNSLRNNFYGVQYGQILEIVSHGKNQTVIFDGLEMKTNSNNWSAPNTGDVSVKVDNTLMQSRIKQGNFVDREGVKIATFGKDMMTSGTERLFDLLNGQDLRGDAIKVRLQNPDTTEVVVFGITVNFQISE